MGLVLFFANYYRLTGNKVYERTADELMDQVIQDLNKNLPIGFGNGLMGIGWGVEYLIQNGYIEGDSLEVCEEMDIKLLELNPTRFTDISLEEGLEGILHYVLAHTKGVMESHGRLPFDKLWYESLYQAMISIRKRDDISPEMRKLSETYCNFLEGKGLDYALQILPYAGSEITSRNVTKSKLGLRSGIAGFILNKASL
jgi:hypothetical protein